MAGSGRPPRSVDVLGARLDLCSVDEARAWLRRALADPWDGRCRHVVTLNPEYVMAARRDPAFAAAIRSADLVTADGAGVVAAAKLLHGAAAERLTGVDLVEWLAEESGPLGAPLFLLGAGPGVGDEAARRLQSRIAGLRLAGAWAEGTPAPEHDGPALDRIAAGGARALAVAYGAPGQIHWIQRNQAALAERGVRVVVGVGGALDYLSGTVQRPPAVVRRLGLEWLVRLLREPWRWRRQTVLPRFAARVILTTLGMRIGSRRRNR